MRRYPHIIEAVYARPWLITPAAHRAIRRALESRLAGEPAPIVPLVVQEAALNKRQEYGGCDQ